MVQHIHHTSLCELKVADSTFIGYVCTYPTLSDIEQYRQDIIKYHHPNAAHVPYAASIIENSISGKTKEEGYDDDDEPTGSHVGMSLLNELNLYKRVLRRQSTIRIRGGSITKSLEDDENTSDDEEGGEGEEQQCALALNNNVCSGPPIATAIIIVRYFHSRLLGVTCGRLRCLYERTARLALHRHMNGKDKPFVERYNFERKGENELKNLYGLGAGDTELILNVVPSMIMNNSDGEEESKKEDEQMTTNSSSQSNICNKLLNELQFEGMVGAKNELLPRLQNLQSDTTSSNDIIPIYRYPGNYSGTEWPTHPWSPTSLVIKQSIEKALQPLYNQRMNHCVSNLYRHGNDRIDHHSDKDLDLNRQGVIVSVSLGSARVMEVRDREYPHDVARVELPPNSMFVLGPYTNARFTHSVLPRKVSFSDEHEVVISGEETKMVGSVKRSDAKCCIEGGGRISLTFRDVRTFLDIKTQRLFGQGVSSSVLERIDIEESGIIEENSLARAVECTREQDTKEKGSAIVFALGVGASVGYVSSRSTKSDTSLLRSISTSVISASASYWYIQRARRKLRQRREEREAREFFSKKSASGNKY